MAEKCNCNSVAENLELWSDSVNSGLLTVISQKEENYEETVELKCNRCGKTWIFTRIEGYHHPVIEWNVKKK